MFCTIRFKFSIRRSSRLSGIAGGLVGVVKDCIIPKVQGTVQTVGNAVLPKGTPKAESSEEMKKNSDSPEQGDIQSPNTSLMSALALENFEPRQGLNLFSLSVMIFCIFSLHAHILYFISSVLNQEDGRHSWSFS
jgi:hypothetical protein